jgi:hypothetical protein
MARSEQLQIRVTPAEKARLKRLAKAAGQAVSAYVLARALPSEEPRLAAVLRALRGDREPRFALAELNDVLGGLAPIEFTAVVRGVDVSGLSPLFQNYVAAMVELAAAQKRAEPPAWVRDVAPLDRPHFGAPLKRLRPHLLRAAPIAFKRRNIFVDASVGDRV